MFEGDTFLIATTSSSNKNDSSINIWKKHIPSVKQEHYSISSWSITMMAIQVLVYLLAISIIMLITAYSIICNLPWWKHLTNMWQWGLQAIDLWSIIMYKVLINKTRFLYWSQQVNKTSWKIILQHSEDRILVPPMQTSQEVPKRQMKDIRKESVWANDRGMGDCKCTGGCKSGHRNSIVIADLNICLNIGGH